MNNQLKEPQMKDPFFFSEREKTFAVTGTFHGSIVEAKTEGEARRIFHKHYKGESIIHLKDISNYNLENI